MNEPIDERHHACCMHGPQPGPLERSSASSPTDSRVHPLPGTAGEHLVRGIRAGGIGSLEDPISDPMVEIAHDRRTRVHLGAFAGTGAGHVHAKLHAAGRCGVRVTCRLPRSPRIAAAGMRIIGQNVAPNRSIELTRRVVIPGQRIKESATKLFVQGVIAATVAELVGEIAVSVDVCEVDVARRGGDQSGDVTGGLGFRTESPFATRPCPIQRPFYRSNFLASRIPHERKLRPTRSRPKGRSRSRPGPDE